MNLLKHWFHPKSGRSKASKPEHESEDEVPTMILDGAPFCIYRLMRKTTPAGPQSKPAASPMPSSR